MTWTETRPVTFGKKFLDYLICIGIIVYKEDANNLMK